MTLGCGAVLNHLAGHLDGEATLLGAEAIDRHLAACERCRVASADHATYLAAMSRAFRPAPAPAALRRRIARRTRGASAVRRATLVSVGAFVAAAGVALLVYSGTRPGMVAQASLAEVAVVHHDAIVAGLAPLDVATSEPARIVSWFRGRVPFALELPRLDNPELKVVGARLVEAAGDLAAVVVYRSGVHTVSLTMAPSGATMPPHDGQSETFRAVRFHLTRLRGHNVIAWSHQGISYALVSDLPAQGRASCAVCHAAGSGLRDVDAFHR